MRYRELAIDFEPRQLMRVEMRRIHFSARVTVLLNLRISRMTSLNEVPLHSLPRGTNITSSAQKISLWNSVLVIRACPDWQKIKQLISSLFTDVPARQLFLLKEQSVGNSSQNGVLCSSTWSMLLKIIIHLNIIQLNDRVLRQIAEVQ